MCNVLHVRVLWALGHIFGEASARCFFLRSETENYLLRSCLHILCGFRKVCWLLVPFMALCGRFGVENALVVGIPNETSTGVGPLDVQSDVAWTFHVVHPSNF